MFKHYKVKLNDRDNTKWIVDFYVHSKDTRTGFMHQAIVTGCLPTKNPSTYSQEERKIRYHRVSYSNRTWEEWGGQKCLRELWDRIIGSKLFINEMFPKNPFREGVPEPKHEDLWEPEYLFMRD